MELDVVGFLETDLHVCDLSQPSFAVNLMILACSELHLGIGICECIDGCVMSVYLMSRID